MANRFAEENDTNTQTLSLAYILCQSKTKGSFLVDYLVDYRIVICLQASTGSTDEEDGQDSPKGYLFQLTTKTNRTFDIIPDNLAAESIFEATESKDDQFCVTLSRKWHSFIELSCL